MGYCILRLIGHGHAKPAAWSFAAKAYGPKRIDPQHLEHPPMSEDLAPAAQMTSPQLIWSDPGAKKDLPTLVRLTPDTLTLANVPSADLADVIDALRNGGEVPGQVIPLASLSKAEGDEDSTTLTVTFRNGPSAKESKTIGFVDKAQREEFLTALVAALGPAWQRGQKRMSPWQAGFWTLLPTAVVALITWGMHAEAAQIAQGLPPVNWGKGRLRPVAMAVHWIERQLGPTGVLIAGAILVSLGLLLFALLIVSPPMSLVVEPAEPS